MWQYKVTEANPTELQKTLTDLGAVGWELVSVEHLESARPYVLILKRSFLDAVRARRFE